MSYENPILLIQQRMNAQIEDAVYKAVQKVGIYVDKDELIKALKYDRDQYEKGYKDREKDIVRCKDCIHRGKSEKCVLSAISEEKDFPLFMLDNRGEWFCADGERR